MSIEDQLKLSQVDAASIYEGPIARALRWDSSLVKICRDNTRLGNGSTESITYLFLNGIFHEVGSDVLSPDC